MAVRPEPKLTYQDLFDFPDDGLRRELIRGEVYVTPAPSKRHQTIVGRLFRMLADHLGPRGDGEVFVGPVNVLLSDHDVPQPDLIFVRQGENDPGDPLWFRGPPALVVEVISDPARDLDLKLRLYESFGVPEYWAIWQELDRIEVFRLGETAYGPPRIVVPGEALSPLALPALVIDVAGLLRR